MRIPNQALAFRPSAEALRALGQPPDVLATAEHHGLDTTLRYAWRFDGSQFLPVDVHVGLADADMTELISGALRPGDVVVTGASLTGR
jgi:hypothetical protein